MTEVRWTRYGGYECSSKGDNRFSALFARLPDGRTIEEHYQCDVKGYNPGGTNWREYKGLPPLDTEADLWEEYLSLWRIWAELNHPLIRELREKCGGVLSDMFANTDISQARALAQIINDLNIEEQENKILEF